MNRLENAQRDFSAVAFAVLAAIWLFNSCIADVADSPGDATVSRPALTVAQANSSEDAGLHRPVQKGGHKANVFPDPAPPVLQPFPKEETAARRPYDRVTVHALPKPLSSDAVTHDWTSFLGPTHNGVSTETHLLKQWPKEGPTLLWEMRKGKSYSSPAIQGDRLVFPHRVEDHVLVDCLHPETGELYWQFSFPSDYQDRYGYNDGPRASPVLDGERVYIYSAKGRLFCLHLPTGQLLWKRDIAKEFEVPQDFFGTATTPLIEGDSLIINVGAPKGPCVVAFHKETGRMIWGAGNRWGPSYASPVPAAIHGRRTVFVFAGGESRPPTGGLICLDPASGNIDFEFPWRSKSYESVNASCPVVIGDQVFISASYKVGGACLRVATDFTHKVAWTNPNVGTHINTAIHRDGYLYVFEGRNEPDASLVCVDLKDGKIVWREVPEWTETVTIRGRTQEAVLSTFRGSLLYADSHFLCLGELGHLLWLDLTPTGYKQLARHWLFGARESWTPLVLSRGLLYVCQNARDFVSQAPPRLLCYDLRSSGKD